MTNGISINCLYYRIVYNKEFNDEQRAEINKVLDLQKKLTIEMRNTAINVTYPGHEESIPTKFFARFVKGT